MKIKQKGCNVRLCRPPMGGVLRLRVASCLLEVGPGPKMRLSLHWDLRIGLDTWEK